MSVHFPDPLPIAVGGLDAQVHRMSGTLSCDYAHGSAGERRNGFQHRSRLLRQPTARPGRMADDTLVSAVRS